jgi:hypothetical protein
MALKLNRSQRTSVTGELLPIFGDSLIGQAAAVAG